MRAYYCDEFVLPLPEAHRFPMAKYRLLREAIVARGILDLEQLSIPAAVDDTALLRAHNPRYVQAVVRGTLDKAAVRRIGFPWSPALVERSRRSAGGTLAACRAALDEGTAVNLAGGTHHAFADHGEGYCVFNDVAIAVRALQAEGRIGRAVIIDCDVHQGNGTASLFQDDNTVFTFSIHGARNYPFRKEASDLDVALDDDTEDDAYLSALDEALVESIRASSADLAIYVAGADPFVGDTLGRLALTKDGLRVRDRVVLGHLRAAGLPVAVVMAGGYARNVDDIVDIHCTTVATTATVR